MATTGFRDRIKTLCPTWLQDGVGERLMYSAGLGVDLVAEKSLQAIRARMPGKGDPSALPILGADRRIRRGFAETDESYAGRLSGAFDSWQIAGTARGKMEQLAGYLSPEQVVFRQVSNSSAWDTLAIDGSYSHTLASPANWDWDGDSTSWWRFWVILYPPASLWVTEGTWGDGQLWGDGGTWGTTATTEQIASLKAIVADWRAAHAVPLWLVIAFDPASFDPAGAPGAPLPDGTWGTWGTDVAGVRVPSRLATARYVDGS